MTSCGADNVDDFVNSFNLEKPYTNGFIKQIKNKMLEKFVDEIIKMSKNNDTVKYSKKQLSTPITYISKTTTMLTEKGVSNSPHEYELYYNCEIDNHNDIHDNVRYELDKHEKHLYCGSLKLDYHQTFKTMLNSSLRTAYFLTKMTDECKIYEVFDKKCSELYHLIFKHILLMDKTYKNSYKLTGTNISSKYLSKYFPGASDDVLNTFDNIPDMFELDSDPVQGIDEVLEHEKYVKQMFCIVIACGYAAEKSELTQPAEQWKFQIIEDKQKQKFHKVLCSIVVYKYVKERISKMEDSAIHESIQHMIMNNNSHGWLIDSLMMGILYTTKISIAKFTKTNKMWENRHECFLFIVNHMVNELNSEKMLTQLIEKSNKMNITDSETIIRITNLKNEIKQSKDYLVVLFQQLIAIIRQELRELRKLA